MALCFRTWVSPVVFLLVMVFFYLAYVVLARLWFVIGLGLSLVGNGVAFAFVVFCMCHIWGCSFAFDISILVVALFPSRFCIWGSFVRVFWAVSLWIDMRTLGSYVLYCCFLRVVFLGEGVLVLSCYCCLLWGFRIVFLLLSFWWFVVVWGLFSDFAFFQIV